MILNQKQKGFLKDNKAMLIELFNQRIEELKNNMVLEEDEMKRNRIRELVIELRYWLIDIDIFTKDKKADKKENFI